MVACKFCKRFARFVSPIHQDDRSLAIKQDSEIEFSRVIRETIVIWANLSGSAQISTFAKSARPLTMPRFRGTNCQRFLVSRNRRYGHCPLMSRPFHVTSIHGGQLMAVRKVSPVAQLVSAIFTTLARADRRQCRFRDDQGRHEQRGSHRAISAGSSSDGRAISSADDAGRHTIAAGPGRFVAADPGRVWPLPIRRTASAGNIREDVSWPSSSSTTPR